MCASLSMSEEGWDSSCNCRRLGRHVIDSVSEMLKLPADSPLLPPSPQCTLATEKISQSSSSFEVFAGSD